MTLDADALVDRRRIKRQLVVWRLATIGAFVLFAVILTLRSAALTPNAYVAQLSVSGVLLGDRNRLDALAQVASDPDIRALIVQIDSPGGTVVAGEELYLAIRKVAETKPVVAVIGNLGTSAGYLVALGADQILARQSSVTGSIGVLIQTADFTELLQLLGISARNHQEITFESDAVAGGGTDARSSGGRPSGGGRHLPVVCRPLVAERRDMAPLEALQLADGRVFTGRQAVANSLVDAIGGIDEAREWLQDTYGIDLDLPTVAVDPKRRFSLAFDLLSLGQKTVFSETLRLDGLVSVWHPESLR